MNNPEYDENIFCLLDEDGALNYGQVYIAKPKNSTGKLPLLMALHGSGREALSYRDIPFYRLQRDIALECGFLFACISNGSHTFGTDTGFVNIKRLLAYIEKNYDMYDGFALWASSAGGLMMHRLFREYKDNIRLLLGTFPIFNPITTNKIKSLLRAFGAADEAELLDAVNHLSPDKYPRDIYSGTKIVIAHGIDDESVDISQSEELYDQVHKYGGDMELIKSPGGHSTENFALYDTQAFHKALMEMRNSLDG